ncbi:TPA: hypothetical protein ACH3X1_014148 [Trebouxia sp. C0004]
MQPNDGFRNTSRACIMTWTVRCGIHPSYIAVFGSTVYESKQVQSIHDSRGGPDSTDTCTVQCIVTTVLQCLHCPNNKQRLAKQLETSNSTGKLKSKFTTAVEKTNV